MRVLIACEFSGVVRDAFIVLGHDAVSCDLLPTEALGPHIHGDVREVLDEGWDLMIAFPPCTHLAVSGARWFKEKIKEQQEAISFVEDIWRSPIKRISIENPVSVLSTKSVLGKPTQIIHPWQFGYQQTKTTCLWLKNLPPIRPTRIMEPPHPKFWTAEERRKWNKVHREPPSPDRWKNRSRTQPGIAAAMAEQWG